MREILSEQLRNDGTIEEESSRLRVLRSEGGMEEEIDGVRQLRRSKGAMEGENCRLRDL